MICGLVLPVHQLYYGGIIMRGVMEYELETKKKHLSKLQDYFRIDIKDIASPKYEDNAINALLEMKKVKTEIEQLEYYLQLKT